MNGELSRSTPSNRFIHSVISQRAFSPAIVGNIPVIEGMSLSVYDSGSVLSYLYAGVSQGIYPPLIFLGIGAMTDFSTMLSNPKLVLLG